MLLKTLKHINESIFRMSLKYQVDYIIRNTYEKSIIILVHTILLPQFKKNRFVQDIDFQNFFVRLSYNTADELGNVSELNNIEFDLKAFLPSVSYI